jgi:hypothetical protein
LYNVLASRASNVGNAPFSPTGAGQDITGDAMRRQNVAPQAFGAAISGVGQGPRMDPSIGLQQPNFGMAHALGGAGSMIGSGIQNFAVQRQLAQILQQGQQSQQPQRQLSGTGVFN